MEGDFRFTAVDERSAGEMLRLRMARGYLARLRGLIGRSRDWLASDEALCFVECSAVHTLGMRLPIDVAFIDASGRVLRSIRRMPPRRFASCRGAAMVLERIADEEGQGRPWPQPGELCDLLIAPGENPCKTQGDDSGGSER